MYYWYLHFEHNEKYFRECIFHTYYLTLPQDIPVFPESATVKRKQKVGPGGDAQLSPGGKIWDVSHSSHSLDSEQSGM